MMRSRSSFVLRLTVGGMLLFSEAGFSQYQAPVVRGPGPPSSRFVDRNRSAWKTRDHQAATGAIPLLNCESAIPDLEEIREQKRQRMQAIQDRLERLLKSTPQTQPVVQPMVKPEVTVEPEGEFLPPKPDIPDVSDDRQLVPFPTDIAPVVSLPIPNADEPTLTESVGDDPKGMTLPEMGPLDDLAPSSKATTPGTVQSEPVSQPDAVMESPTATPEDKASRSPIADMIEALANPRKKKEVVEGDEEPVDVPSSLSATTVLNSPVDRLKLADNLFATREYSLALQMYDAADSSDTRLSNEDKAWATYQKAGCYRRLEMMDEAQSLYRQVAGDADTKWLAKVSRWWLDRIAEREKLKQEIGQVKEVLDTIKKAKLDGNSNSK